VPAGYSYVWGDDFGGVVGQGQPKTAVNESSWTFENLHVNNEKQNYTRRQCTTHPTNWNSCIEDGRLRMQARNNSLSCADDGTGHPANPDCADHFGWYPADMAVTKPYTSSRLMTKNKVAKRYGYIEFRAKLPHANLASPQSGSWAAIWLLGQNVGEGPVDTRRTACTSDTQCSTMAHETCVRGRCAVTWPWTGENDVMEWRSSGGRSEMAHNPIWIGADGNMDACNEWPEGGETNCGVYTGGSMVKAGSGGRYYWDEYAINHQIYHTYGLLWTPSEKTYYVDGVKFATLGIGAAEAEFQEEMFIIMNYAIGGDLGGTVDITDWANAYQDVDYIEWYQASSCTPNCNGRTCGTDGCGGSCGSCGGGKVCNAVLQCTATLQAEDGAASGTTLEVINGQGRQRMDSSGDSVCWSGINMAGVTGVKATYANGEPAGDKFIVRYQGNTLGNITLASTGSWSVDTNTTVGFAAQAGSGTLCVEAQVSSGGWIASLNSVTLL
jgi:beta-glucanase (GH16 family)